MDSPKEYLSRAGIKYRRLDAKEVRFDCPACNEDEGFSLNTATGLWVCMRASCNERGNLHRLKVLRGDIIDVDRPVDAGKRAAQERFAEQFISPVKEPSEVDKWHQALLKGVDAKSAREYLAERKLGPKVIRLARLGWVPQNPGPSKGDQSLSPQRTVRRRRRRTQSPSDGPTNHGLITIPYPVVRHRNEDEGFSHRGAFKEDDTPLVKMRRVPPEPIGKNGKPLRYERIKGGANVLYAPCGIDESETLLIVGGELDVLSIIQSAVAAGHTRYNVITPGPEGAWQPEWTEEVEAIEDIVLLYDNDPGGRAGAEKVAKALGRHRCRIATWPQGINDANDALQQGKLEFFEMLGILAKAESAAAKGLAQPSQLADSVCAHLFGSEVGAKGYPTGWVRLDQILGGWRSGEITLASGETGGGKTTWSSQSALKMVERRRRVLYIPAEVGPRSQIIKMVRQYSATPTEMLTEEGVRQTLFNLDNLLWIVKQQGAIKLEVLRETLLYAIIRLGVEFVVIDHMDFIVGPGKDQWNDRAKMLVMLIDVFNDTGAHLLLIAHPDKSAEGNRMIMPWNIKGTSDLIQGVHNGLSVFRPRNAKDMQDDPDRYGYSNVLTWKSREATGCGALGEGVMHLRFDRRTELYEEVACQQTGLTLEDINGG